MAKVKNNMKAFFYLMFNNFEKIEFEQKMKKSLHKRNIFRATLNTLTLELLNEEIFCRKSLKLQAIAYNICESFIWKVLLTQSRKKFFFMVVFEKKTKKLTRITACYPMEYEMLVLFHHIHRALL